MAFSLVLRFLSIFPTGILFRLGDILGFTLKVIPNRSSRLILKNVRMCFPELDEAQQRQLHHRTITQFCYSIFELPAVWCWRVDKILARITQQQVCEEFKSSRKARIIIAPHLGCWELLNLWLSQQGDYKALYKPATNPAVDDFLIKARSRNGADMLPITAGGFRRLSQGLRGGNMAMILPDQRPHKDKAQAMSKFFGHDAPTTPLIHSLCQRIDCDVFIAAVVRNDNTGHYTLKLEPLDHATLAMDQQTSLDYMNGRIAEMIRQNPSQYQWGYSRFRLAEYRLANL